MKIVNTTETDSMGQIYVVKKCPYFYYEFPRFNMLIAEKV
jgi:hypothetical protein